MSLELLDFVLGLLVVLVEDLLETIELSLVGVFDSLYLLLQTLGLLLLGFEVDVLLDFEVVNSILETVDVLVLLGELVLEFVNFDLHVSLLSTVPLQFLGDLVVLGLVLSLELINLLSQFFQVIFGFLLQLNVLYFLVLEVSLESGIALKEVILERLQFR